MSSGKVWPVVVTVVLIAASAVGTGFLSFFTWALALNGFMGQERAVNASMITFIALAILVSLISLLLGALVTFYLSSKRGWNPIGSMILSTIVFATVCGGLQIGSVVVSAIVANQLRTTR